MEPYPNHPPPLTILASSIRIHALVPSCPPHTSTRTARAVLFSLPASARGHGVFVQCPHPCRCFPCFEVCNVGGCGGAVFCVVVAVAVCGQVRPSFPGSSPYVTSVGGTMIQAGTGTPLLLIDGHACPRLLLMYLQWTHWFDASGSLCAVVHVAVPSVH